MQHPAALCWLAVLRQHWRADLAVLSCIADTDCTRQQSCLQKCLMPGNILQAPDFYAPVPPAPPGLEWWHYRSDVPPLPQPEEFFHSKNYGNWGRQLQQQQLPVRDLEASVFGVVQVNLSCLCLE